MEVDRQVLDLIDLVYQSAADQQLWPAFLQRFAAVLEGVFPILFVQAVPGAAADRPTVLATDIPGSSLVQYQDYYAARNVLLLTGSRLLRQGQVRTGEMMCSRDTFLESEFYNDFLRPLDIRYSLGGTIAGDGRRSCNISLFRGHRGKPFEEAELVVLGTLMPHMRRAMDVQARLQDLEDRRRWHAESLDRLALGVICLGPGAEVRHANRAARSLLEAKDGVRVDAGVLRAGAPEVTCALRALVASVAQAPLGRATAAGDVLVLPRAGKRPLEALIVPASVSPCQSRQCATAALMFLSDPEREPAGVEAKARRLYRLTPAEARVAGGLMKGEAIEEIAERSETSVHTVRTHVKRVLEKTATNRQADLLRLLGRWASVEAGDEERRDGADAAGAGRRVGR